MFAIPVELKNKYKVVRRITQLKIIFKEFKMVTAIQKQIFIFNKKSYTENYRKGLKFLWRYIIKDIDTTKKLEIVYANYFLANQLFPEQLRNTLAMEGVLLFEVKNNESTHSISLCLPDNTLFEGDFLLKYCFNGAELFRLTFSFMDSASIGLNEGQVVLIGGSQGTAKSAQLMRVAAKENKEVCPSVLTFIALQALSSELNFSTVLGINARLHVSEGVFKYPELHQSTYDDMWQAHGGELKQGFFKMGVTPHLKDLALVKSSHRRRAKLKQLHKLELFHSIKARLGSLLVKPQQEMVTKSNKASLLSF